MIEKRFSKICDFETDDVCYPATPNDSLGRFTENAFREDDGSEEEASQAEKKGDFPAVSTTYTERDLILYALGVGCTRHDLQFVYENHENFSALPSFGVIPAFPCMTSIPFGDYIPNPDMVGLPLSFLLPKYRWSC